MLIVEVHATSHIGRVRKGNEDNYLVLNIDASQTWTSEQDATNFPVDANETRVSVKADVLPKRNTSALT